MAVVAEEEEASIEVEVAAVVTVVAVDTTNATATGTTDGRSVAQMPTLVAGGAAEAYRRAVETRTVVDRLDSTPVAAVLTA